MTEEDPGTTGISLELQMGISELSAKDTSFADTEETSGRFRDCTNDVWFQGIIYGVILINAVQMGVEIDVEAADELTSTAKSVFTGLELMATLVFLLELCLKLYFLRVGYFSDRYNWLDFFIVMFSLVDACFSLANSEVDLSQISILRIVRLFRLLRVVRLIRAFREMTLILNGIFQAFRTMIWVIMLLPLILYAAAIPCVQFLGTSDLGYPYSRDEEAIERLEFMTEFNNFVYFGSISRSMFTLFNIAILAEHREIGRPLLEKMPLVLVGFLLFTVLMSFGIMNVLVGVIVESTLASAAKMDSQVKMLEMVKRAENMTLFFKKLEQFDANLDNFISIDELELMFEDEEVRKILDQLELPPWFTAGDLLTILDNDGKGSISLQDFTLRFFSLFDKDEFHIRCENRCTLNVARQLCEQFLAHLPGAEDFLPVSDIADGTSTNSPHSTPRKDTSSPVSATLVALLDTLYPTRVLREPDDDSSPPHAVTAPSKLWPEMLAFLERVDLYLNTASEQASGRRDERLQQLEERLWSLEQKVHGIVSKIPQETEFKL